MTRTMSGRCIESTTEVFSRITMYALVCLSLLACAFAAPQYHFRPPPRHHHHEHYHGSDLDDFMTDDVFDTGRFFKDFNREMEQLEKAIEELVKHFPTQATSGLQGNQYKININLSGFDEKEISVKAREGLVMVQAVHKTEEGGERSYLDVRTLPSFVKTDTGSWTYGEDLLKIVFDVKEGTGTEVAGSTEAAVVTEAPDREEIESQENDNTNQDADVGVRGDTELITNEIPKEQTVEATTYAVDFNNEVEFVPVRLNPIKQ
ncbi:LOW QUALITY PROTEIN: uncharacterized protein LOC125225408 [Leguminivora glycinivorella]|uniref:LOW QUALITY PROTEIN: uncharacterized protein LOC125225408 n=1 Tax=Leguminivora glycinivorella TaxID=1035111 RepID=UPI00200EA023|nr:LOW QUALITY PROTEIN: uncharacterized protein LOC125225408 [Leguminivora glycinivorella]